jgi:hypothetical protein
MLKKLANYRAYKEDDFARAIAVFSLIQPQAVPFYGLQFQYALDHADRFEIAPSINAMLSMLLSEYQAAEERVKEQVTLEGLMPPAYHQWVTFEQPYRTPYGLVGGFFLWDCKNQEDLAAISATWPAFKRAAFYQWVEETPASWALDVLDETCNQVLMTYIFNPAEKLGERWQRNSWMDCPFDECVPAAGERCPRCAEMLELIPRWIVLLQALLLGFFQEIEVKERTITETRSVKRADNPKKKKRIEIRHKITVLDVSRREMTITPDEIEELNQEKHSWVAGKEILTLDSIDWNHPPADTAVILAPSPVKRHKRELRSARFVHKQGQTITIDRYHKPRQPMYFGSWKRRQWDFIRVMASAYEAEKAAGSLTQQ